jgi:ADP-ribosyl-[dinitrogen reductase] hydrolase
VTTPPFDIDTVATPDGGQIGMMHCPGRCGGPYGQRELAADIAVITAWGADVVLSLNQSDEFARLGVPAFEATLARQSFRWVHAPIPDFSTPGPEFAHAWATAGPLIASTLRDGGKVAVHCAAGLGRTGTLVAKLLIDLGADPDDAVARVRKARPGTIETERQAHFVRVAPRLLPDP